MLTISAIPAFNDNYIWCLSNQENRKALVVDPGQAGPVLEHLADNGLVLDTILVTHHHPDHVGGISELMRAFPECGVTGPAESPFTGCTDKVHPGDEVLWENLTFQVLGVPGHTLDHIAYFTDTEVDGRPVLFCGDTLFVCGCGRLFEGKPEQMRQSLQTLRALPERTAVYCAHEYTLANLKFARSWLPGDEGLKAFEIRCKQRREDGYPTVPSVLGEEKRLNPFLRWDDPVVVDAARNYCARHGLPADSENAIFAAIRHGKDNF
ncbi:hydroxyacylglutathione hydrolase [Marinobacter sp. M216]|uniref:Hydroxyacylglutathione hydrolase n=1 Tax=Marinobacter albus TaxID=3030833 RepID=A0ABT7HE00_9GAMM|nr:MULTISPECIES: hydroxyacylglutathione hydrolase [unclassified Marinobacter]MBW7469959.1 hydroxyacylglutathione hydrolase [Marinobacter sp. F4218]MDK9557781.1 hydroxyacylglutathione hydrolase [Marinobacter sp. M216]